MMSIEADMCVCIPEIMSINFLFFLTPPFFPPLQRGGGLRFPLPLLRGRCHDSDRGGSSKNLHSKTETLLRRGETNIVVLLSKL